LFNPGNNLVVGQGVAKAIENKNRRLDSFFFETIKNKRKSGIGHSFLGPFHYGVGTHAAAGIAAVGRLDNAMVFFGLLEAAKMVINKQTIEKTVGTGGGHGVEGGGDKRTCF